MKKIFLIILLTVLTMPFGVQADEASRQEQLDLIPTREENGIEYIDMVSINPDIILSDNRCDTTREEIISMDPERYVSLTPELEEEIDFYIESSISSCVQDYREVLLNFTLSKMGIDFYKYYYDFQDATHLTISYHEGDSVSTKDVVLRYKENDTAIRNAIVKEKEKIQDRYTIYGLAVINSVAHYGGIDANIYNNDLVLYRFPELKELMEENPDYNFTIRLRGAGGNPYETGNGGFIGVFKNDTLYDLKETMFSMNHILYIDEAAEGTIYERAEKRISDYLKDEFEVVVNPNPMEVFTDDPYMEKDINDYLGQSSGHHIGTYTEVRIGDINHTILIVEIPKVSLDIVDIKSKDMLTGINIKTKSFDVPIDAQIEVENVKDADYVVKAIKNNNLKIINAYDINLKKATDGTLIREIEDGVEVYIPVTGYKNGDKLKVYYIKSDATVGETLDAEVVTIDDVMYAKFTTNHFSTYAIGNIANPDTGDNIYTSIVLLTISLGLIIITKKKIINN